MVRGKRIVVTGAGAGIGAGVATLAAETGARVLLADIDFAAAGAVAEQIRGKGGQAEACALDLADPTSISAMIETAVSRFGGLDGLVNNAAKTVLTARDHGVETMDLQVWDETLHVNLRGTMLACKYAIPALRASGGGAIVNIASGSALRGSSELTAYGVSKAGIVTLSQYIAAQHGREGIRCNAIAPGIILTPKTADAFGTPEAQAKALPFVLSPRLGVPDDIAWAVLWLVGESGAYVNGQCISVDGGLLMHQRQLAEAMASPGPGSANGGGNEG